MLIQCTSCGAQAKIPDSKEGAKVRCASCSHIYVARRPGAKAAKKEDPTKYFIIGGAVVVAAVLLVMLSGDEPPPPPKVAEVEKLAAPVVVDELGWDSPAVKLVRDLHVAAVAQNRMKLSEAIDPEAAYADWRLRELAADEAAIADANEANKDLAEGVEPTPVPEARVIPPWAEVQLPERNLFVAGLVEQMLLDDPENLLTKWMPFSGKVVSMEDDLAVLHLQLNRLQGDDGTNRTIEWRLVDRRAEGGAVARWRVAGWNRYLTPEEIAANRKKKHKKTTKRTLEDGSLVIEGEIRVIPYEADVPQPERDRIDGLIRDLMNLDARPRVRTEAHEALLAAGKPAIAPLLSIIATTVPIDSDNEAIQLGLVHRALSEMTGYVTTYKPDESLGATKERMDSGLRQWFGWYDRKYKKYTGSPNLGEDPLFDDPDWQPRTEKERLEFERAKREAAGGG